MTRSGHGLVTVLFLVHGAGLAAGQEQAPLPPPIVSLPEPGLAAAAPAPAPEKARPGIPPELKLTGYVQGRYEWHEDANFGLDPARLTPRASSRFIARRARLKATYARKNAELVLQISGSSTEAFNIADAEASFVDSWTPLKLKLTLGQFKVPFGFEVLQSSSDREAPERSAFVRAFFPGERDRGVRLTGGFGFLGFHLALLNGNGVRDAIYGGSDQTSWKDLVARLQAKLGLIDIGASAYWGRTLLTARDARPVGYERYGRMRLGTDAQLKFGVPGVGDLHVRGELIFSQDENLAFAGTAADPCRDFDSLGWYATVVQRLPGDLGIALRLDQYDALAGVDGVCARYEASRQDRATAIGGGLFADTFAGLRATLWYEHQVEQGKSLGNDAFTAQLQVKF